MTKKRVAVALSGGVDSSMAALLLQEVGYEVVGITMRLWHEKKATLGGQHYSCYSTQDIYDVEQICLTFGIPLHIIDLEREFKQYVIDYFCQEYRQGRTPNPCIACNQHIKFGFVLNQALFLGADYLATGHYARTEYFDDAYHLLKGVDLKKDQSYMLCTLGQEKLSHLLFPLGGYLKAEVKELARQKGLPIASKPSSQDICFITTDYGTLLGQHSATSPGEIVNRWGEVLGKHRGIAFYTIGQRHGFGLASSSRLYVTKIEPDINRITVGSEEEICSQKLTASKVNWVSGRPPSKPVEITAKIRYKSPEAVATLYPESDSAEIQFHQLQHAITPGQAVVFYRDSEVLGGGIIEN